ncbi:MAG: carboxypeptidase regulatory-like domain-containing protein [Breznakibacter sp.]
MRLLLLSVQLFFFLFFFSVGGFAQNKVTLWGYVRDAEGHPVVQAVVWAANTSYGATTDEEGNYRLALDPGRYEILVTSVGFEKYQTVLNVTAPARLDVTLQNDPIALQTVEVRGKTKSQQVRESVFSANALDIKSLINGQNDLAKIVGRSNGVNIREDGGMGSDFDLSVNGLSGNSIRYFIDGMPMSALGNGVNLANIPLNVIDRVEVYKGVVPVHLGADALGGAVNVITKKQASNYVDVSYGYGSFNTHRAEFNARYRHPGTGVTIRPAFGYNFSDNNYTMKGVEVWNKEAEEFQITDAKRFHDGYASSIGRIEVGVTDKKWADALFVAGSVSQVEKELQTGSIQSVVYGQAKSKSDARGLSGTYRKDNFFVKRLAADISYSHTWDNSVVIDTVFRKYRWDGSFIESSRNEITGRAKSLRHIDRPLDVLGIGANYPLGSHNALSISYSLNSVRNSRYDGVDTEFVPSEDRFVKQILGFSYSQDYLDSRLSNVFFVKNYTSRLSVGQQDLYWITGSDVMKGTSTTTNQGAGAGSRYRFMDALSIKASYEYSVRLPLAREFLGNGSTIYPNFQLAPEHGNNANLGLFGNIVLAAGHRLDYEINGFVRKVEDYIRLVVSEAEGMSQYDNVSNVSVAGIESEFRYKFDNALDVTANFSYLNEKNKTKYQANGKPEITYNNRMPNRPWLYSNLAVNYHKYGLFGGRGSHLHLSYYLQYVHWFYLTWEGYGALKSKAVIPTQCVGNAVMAYSWQKDRYNVSLACDNVFDRVVYDNYKLQKPGRSFFLKFRLFINSL